MTSPKKQAVKKVIIDGRHPNFGKQVTAKLSTPSKPALKSALKKPVVSSPGLAQGKPVLNSRLPAGIPKKPTRIAFANTQGKSLTATKTIPRVGDKKWPKQKKSPPISIAAYQKMLAKRNKYKWRLSVLENEKVGRVRTPWCGFGKCPVARPPAVVEKEIREVKNSMNALNSSIARQKKTIQDFDRRR